MWRNSYYEVGYKVRVLIGADLQFEMSMSGKIRSELLRISWETLGTLMLPRANVVDWCPYLGVCGSFWVV